MANLTLQDGSEVYFDDEDLALVTNYNWYAHTDASGKKYAYANQYQGNYKNAIVKMHRLIMDTDEGLDHKNRNGLDNRRENLRIASKSQNGCNRGPQRNNTSGFKGVTFHKKSGKWMARITIEGKTHYLGLFLSKEGAAIAYDDAAKRYHGEFAWINGDSQNETG